MTNALTYVLTAAVLITQIREAPNVAEADGVTDARKQKFGFVGPLLAGYLGKFALEVVERHRVRLRRRESGLLTFVRQRHHIVTFFLRCHRSGKEAYFVIPQLSIKN